MRRIKKDNLKTDQTVFAFACPCAACRLTSGCDCASAGYTNSSWTVIVRQTLNRNIGGSMVGGG